MDNTTSFNNNIDTLFSDLHNFVNTDTVLGTPLTVENKTLVPLMSVTLGYGSTGMGGKTSMGNGGASTTSGGIGLGAKVSASGIIVIDKDSVQVIPANTTSSMNQLMEKIPQAISSLGQNMMQGGANQGQGQGQQQQQNNTPQNQQSSQQQGQQSGGGQKAQQ